MSNPTPPPSADILNLQNLGAIIKVEIAYANFIQVSKPNSKNQVTVTNDLQWNDMQLTPETASLKESCKEVVEGLLYNIKAEWQSPSVSQDSYAAAHKYLGKKVAIKFTTSNGIVLIVGETDNPAYFLLDQIIPKDVAGFNSYLFTLNHASPHPVYYVA